MNINLVYDFKSVNGFSYNSIDYWAFNLFFELSFLKSKENINILNNSSDKHINTGELNLTYFNQSKIHISEIDNSMLFSNDMFIYPIATNAENSYSFGVEDDYKTTTIIDLVSLKAKEYTKKYKNFKILIYCGLEHEMPFEYFKNIYISLQRNNINPNKIWIVSNNFENINNNIKFLNKFKINHSKTLNFLVYYEQLKSKANEILDDNLKNLFVSEDNIVKIKKNKCLMLNRRLHWHRKIFLSLISDDNLFQNNLISFDLPYNKNKIDDNFIESIKNDNYLKVDMFFKKTDFNIESFNSIQKTKIINGYKQIEKIKIKQLDVDNFESIDGRYLELDNKELYEQTYFSLVAETEFFEKWNGYTTEKIIKPIQQFHPFIILGRPYSLKYLKSYGFKTFSSVWDETYDDELVNSKRIFKVYELFKELNNKSDGEWLDILKKIKEILIYNRNLLKSYSYKNDDLVINNFKKYLSNEHIQENPKLLQTP